MFAKGYLAPLSAAFVLVVTLSVSEGGNMVNRNAQSQSLSNGAIEDVLKAVAGKKIFFGHQSVGFNILEGINDIVGENPAVELNIVKTADTAAFDSPVFAHNTVGLNDDPRSKLRDFENQLQKGIGNNADIAFFKFCYIDVHRGSDVKKLFSEYKDTMGRLKKDYPQTTFAHVTVPLTTPTPPLKAFVKRLMGKQENNINRNLFNDMLLKEYEGKEPIFDLAKYESTYANGSRAVSSVGGTSYYSLVPEYTDDGGHLNRKGRKTVALEFLRFLASVGSR